MAKAPYAIRAEVGEIGRLIDDIPSDLKWDMVQLVLDLAGVVNPAADAASAFISLARGDLLGAAIGAVSIIPVGDVAKLAKFQKYRKSLARLVDTATQSPRLAKVIEPVISQLDELLSSIRGFMGSGVQDEWFRELDQMRAAIRRYHAYLQRVKLVDSKGVIPVARSLGRSSGQFYIRRGDRMVTANVDEVLDLLQDGAGIGRHPAVKRDSKELLDRLAMSREWRVSAGPHRKGDPGSSTRDATTHITVTIDTSTSYHLRLDKRGHLFQVTDEKGSLSGIKPWSSPGT